MDLQAYLTQQFRCWRPAQPRLLERSRHHVTLSWSQEEETFGFLDELLLYRLERKEKIPPWVLVYSGGKTTKTIDNLAPSQPHKFKLQVQLKASVVKLLAEKALQHYGSEQAIYERFRNDDKNTTENNKEQNKIEENHDDDDKLASNNVTDKCGDREDFDSKNLNNHLDKSSLEPSKQVKPWLESRWSEEVWTATDTEGPSVICFCMAVRYGYLKQLQQMLDDRPQLIEIVNSVNGLTPLITAIMKGNFSTVKFLVQWGADVNQKSSAGQTPLQLAVYSRRLDAAELLIEKGADFMARDLNQLRVEHYSVDSGLLAAVRYVCERGGDLSVTDSNGWTPLFRAVIQGAKVDLIEELISRGADTAVVDYAGLSLGRAARLLKDRRGYSQEADAVLRLVDPSYPHEQALTHFTRLTNKISSVQTIFK